MHQIKKSLDIFFDNIHRHETNKINHFVEISSRLHMFISYEQASANLLILYPLGIVWRVVDGIRDDRLVDLSLNDVCRLRYDTQNLLALYCGDC